MSHFISFIEHFIVICSILSFLLPPIEWFDKWPKFQSWYKIVILAIVHYGSLNLRGMFWSSQFTQNQQNQQLSVKNGTS